VRVVAPHDTLARRRIVRPADAREQQQRVLLIAKAQRITTSAGWKISTPAAST
jgi:hypothetical protein